MSEGISEEDYERKIAELKKEIETNKLEAERRKSVAQMKTFGFIIEWIDSEREKLRIERESRFQALSAMVTASGSDPKILE